MSNFLKQCEFAVSVFDTEKLPSSGGEIVFIGRSNVGKSSIINALCEKDISYTSKKPGCTKSINFFYINRLKKIYLVDLPGYGFALANRDIKEKWHTLMPDYLAHRPEIEMVYAIIDAKIGFMDNDIDVIDFLVRNRIPFSLVLNKVDRIKKEEAEALLEKVKNDPLLMVSKKQYIVSAKKPTVGQLNQLKRDINFFLK